MKGFVLTGGRTGVRVGLEILRKERFGVFGVSVQRQQERGPLLHDPHARMGMPVDAPLVALGFSEESFQIQIILRKVQPIAPRKHAVRETLHHPPHVLAERIRIVREQALDFLERCPTLFRGTVFRVEGHVDRADVLDLSANRLLLGCDRGPSSVDAPGEAIELFVRRPPF